MMENKKKRGKYERVVGQLDELLCKTTDPDARMATILAVLHYKFDYFFWTGFYFLKNGELTVKSYQGPLSCQVLKKDTGVCWTAINQQRNVIVPDVHQFPGHIACNAQSKSEIVVPVRNREDKIAGVLDIDSTSLNAFDEMDARFLEQIVKQIFVI